MKKLRKRLVYILGLLGMALFWSCSDEALLDNTDNGRGKYQYCLYATISQESTRVSVTVDDLGAGLDLHWEEGDEIVLTPEDDSTAQYVFKAVPYIYDTEAMEPVRPKGDEELGANEILVYFFEYQGDTDIPNAESFTGTATYKPPYYEEKWEGTGESEGTQEPECKSRVVLTQAEKDDPSHLKKVETLTAHLEDVELAKNAYSWVKNNEWENNFFDHHDHVVFEHTAGCYAYLKVILHGFKYSIWGGGTVNVYIMDETPDLVNDEYVPDGKIEFGNKDWDNSDNKVQIVVDLPNLPEDVQKNIKASTSAKFPKSDQIPFIDVPEYWELEDAGTFQETTHKEWFDSYTQHYKMDDIYATFYVPIDPVTIPAGRYIDVVLQDGWSGDLYVWQKKVPYMMSLEAGKMYTLDYRDKRTEYALEIVKNVTYMRSYYLEQPQEGVKETAPVYDQKGNKAIEGGTSVHPNRFAYPDKLDYLNFNDVKEIRKHNAAFYISEAMMAGICRTDFQYYEYNDNGEWINGQNIVTTTIEGENVSDNVKYSKEYMQKISKGYITESSEYHIGRVSPEANSEDKQNLCIEYVLQNRFDPVRKSPKTSNLWRAPYGRDIMSLCKDKIGIVTYPGEENGKRYLTIENVKTGHRFCLPYVMEMAEPNTPNPRGKKWDGSDGITSRWDKNPVDDWRITSCQSLRSFGYNNSAYFQTSSPSIFTKPDKPDKIGMCGMVAKFSVALPVIPVFKWRNSKTPEDDKMIPWEDVKIPGE